MSRIPVEGQPHLVRDSKTRAIINTDRAAHKKFMEQRAKKNQINTDVENLKTDVEDIKSSLSKILQLLEKNS
jgi:hypothetical protein